MEANGKQWAIPTIFRVCIMVRFPFHRCTYIKQTNNLFAPDYSRSFSVKIGWLVLYWKHGFGGMGGRRAAINQFDDIVLFHIIW